MAAAGNYIIEADVDNWPTPDVPAERQATIDRAEQLIEKITHDFFYSKALEIYRNGNGADHLILGLCPDILTVTEILVYGIALDSSWYTFDINAVYLDPESATGGIDDPELLLRLKYKKGIFSKGINNIKITGTYGWVADTCPASIEKATVILCRFENDETLYTSYDDVIEDKLADATYKREFNKRFLTGIHEADKLIRNYIRNKPLMAAV